MKQNSKIYYIIIFTFTLLLSQDLTKIGFISSINGSCNVENVELNRKLHPLSGNSIFNYDIISSKDNSYCEMTFNELNTIIHLDENTKIKIITDKYSRVIKLFSGSIYVQNAKTKIKTYVQSFNNDIYINNNRVWIDFVGEYDQLIAIDRKVDIYNHLSNKNIQSSPMRIYQIYNNGEVDIDDNISKIPEYVLNDKTLKIKKNNVSKNQIFLNDYDLIPIYGDQERKIFDYNGFDYIINTGTRYMNSKPYLSINFSPMYRYNNLIISANLDLYIDADKKILNQWKDGFDILEKINLNYNYSNYYNSISIYAGKIPNITFGHGYLVNNLSNSFDSPMQRNHGLNINFKLDNDFMNFQFFIPSVRDLFEDGGVLGLHSSLFLSHRFPLTIGVGLVIDLNQFSQASSIYDLTYQSLGNNQRTIIAGELDLNLSIVKKMHLDVSLFGEFVGIWYDSPIHYMQYQGALSLANDRRWREGSCGIMAPGISIKLKNKYEIKFAVNFNSGSHIPSYFNTTYLYNKSIYFKTDQPLDFNSLPIPLLTEQIEMLNAFAINEDSTEFLIPKEIYPIINNTFNPFPVYGFTGEFKFHYKNKVDFSFLGSFYMQNTEVITPGNYYTIESKVSIRDNVLKNISFIDFYLSNIFFWSIDDQDKLSFGCSMGFKLPFGMSLKFDLGKVYYDSNLDGDKTKMLNTGIDFGINF